MLRQKENGYELEIDNSKVIFDKTGEFRTFIGISNEKYRKHLLNIVFEDKFELLTNPFTKSIIQTLIKDLKESKLDNSTLKDQLQTKEEKMEDSLRKTFIDFFFIVMERTCQKVDSLHLHFSKHF